MSEILNRFSLEAAKFNGQIFLCLFLIWAAIVSCAIISINSHNFSDRRRWTWICIVVGVPLFGVLAYLPFSLRREDLPHVFLMAVQMNQRARKAAATPNTKALTKKERSV